MPEKAARALTVECDCEGEEWLARAVVGDTHFDAWGKTRKKAVQKVLKKVERAQKRSMKGQNHGG